MSRDPCESVKWRQRAQKAEELLRYLLWETADVEAVRFLENDGGKVRDAFTSFDPLRNDIEAFFADMEATR